MSSGTLKSAHDLVNFFRKLTEHIAAFALYSAVQMAKESEILLKEPLFVQLKFPRHRSPRQFSFRQ